MSSQKSFHSFIDILYVLVQNRGRIILVTLIMSFIMAGLSLMMPKTYTSTTVLMVPKEDAMLGFTSIQGISSLGSFGMLGESPEILRIKAIFDSRLLREKIVQKFDLQKRWENEFLEETLIELEQRVKIDIRPEGTIAVSMEMKTPWLANENEDREARQLAAMIANEIVTEMDIINKVKRTEKARATRIFIENRLSQNIDEIRLLEDSTRSFSEKYNLINIESQTMAAVDAAANLQSEIIQNEILLYMFKRNLPPDHPDIKDAELRLEALQKQAEVFENEDLRKQSELAQVFPNFNQAPDITIKYFALVREMKVQETIYEFLMQQYEQAKLQETKDTPTIQLLDSAVERELRTKPKRKLLVVFTFFMTFFVYSMYIITYYKIGHIKEGDPIRYEKIRFVLRGINIFKKIPHE